MAKKILIVDDDPDVILVLSTILQDQGYETLAGSNGVEGWRIMKKDAPDLVLLDLMMPQKSGISLLSDMKKDDDLSRIPVIMVTGVSGETGIHLESFLERGAEKAAGSLPVRPEGFIEKPVDPEKLIALIKDFLG
jgi:CheY-like chemotaxis protein